MRNNIITYNKNKQYYFKPSILDFANGNTQRDYKISTQPTKTNFTSIGVPTLIAVSTCLLFTKGVQRNIGKFFSNFNDYLESRLLIHSSKNNKKITDFYSKSLIIINSFFNKAKSINNITSLKDILFKKLMYKTKITEAVHDSITRIFDNISQRTIKKAYINTEKAFQIMESNFDNLDKYILQNSGDEKFIYKGKEYTTRELLDIAKEYREIIKLSVNTFISTPSQIARQKHIKEVNSKLYTTFWEASFKGFATSENKFKRKEMWQTFIAEEQMKYEKSNLAKNVAVIRNLISYNNEDKSIAISKILSDLRKMIPSFDIEGFNLVKKLEWFAKDGNNFNKNINAFLKELNKLPENKNHKNINPKIIEKLQLCKESYVSLIKDILKEDEPGEIQNLISIYYEIAPFEFSKSGTLNSVKEAVKNFDKSVNLEINEYFDKVRDLELGSAPTDILTILGSTCMITRDLLEAKDNKQKTSVLLTSGIPLAGAIATIMISTTKLVSGGKSLALGALSGVALNLLGKKIDNHIIFHKNCNKTLNY